MSNSWRRDGHIHHLHGRGAGTNRFEVSLTGGQLIYENGRLTLARPDTPADRLHREYEGGFGKPNVTVADITPDEPYTMHAGVIRAFIDHILTGAPMIADGREGAEQPDAGQRDAALDVGKRDN